MTKIPTKKILISLDEKCIERLDKIADFLNEQPEEGGGWNRSRTIRVLIYKKYKEWFK